MKKFIYVNLLVVLISCTAKDVSNTYAPITKKQFLESPLGFKESIDNFSKVEKPNFSTKKLLRRNKHYPEKTDTIYEFKYKKSVVFFYKTHLGEEFLLAGKILNKQINLKNGIHVGMNKTDFTNRFEGNPDINSDSLEMKGEGTKYTFIFKKAKLYRINIDNYFD